MLPDIMKKWSTAGMIKSTESGWNVWGEN